MINVWYGDQGVFPGGASSESSLFVYSTMKCDMSSKLKPKFKFHRFLQIPRGPHIRNTHINAFSYAVSSTEILAMRNC